MSLIILLPERGQSCHGKSTAYTWDSCSCFQNRAKGSTLGVNPQNEMVFQGHTQPLILQIGENKVYGWK